MKVHYLINRLSDGAPDVGCGTYGLTLCAVKKDSWVTCKTCLAYLNREAKGKPKQQNRIRVSRKRMKYS